MYETNDGWCLSESSGEFRKSIRPMECVVSPPPFNVEVHAASTLGRRDVTPSRRSPRERCRVSLELFFGYENGYMNDTDAEEEGEEDNDNSEIQIIPEIARPLSPDDMDEEGIEILGECMVSRVALPYGFDRFRSPSIVETPAQGTNSLVHFEQH